MYSSTSVLTVPVKSQEHSAMMISKVSAREKETGCNFCMLLPITMQLFRNKLVAFVKQEIKNTFGEYLAAHNMTQARIAETEKYAHVTFFFNGGVEEPNKGEDRILVKSPKVATYDLKPEMSAYEVCDKLVDAIKSDKYDVIIINFANPDMVGHTGVEAAAIKAVEVVDECVGSAVDASERSRRTDVYLCRPRKLLNSW